jgi:hypothetical protein
MGHFSKILILENRSEFIKDSLLFCAPSWFQEASTFTPTLLLFACHFKFRVPGEILISVTAAAFLQQFSSQSGSNARALGVSW